MICVHRKMALSLAEGETFYGRRVFEPSGQAPGFSVPQWRNSAIVRLLQGAWVMSRYTRPVDGGTIDFRPPEAHCFVEWHLGEGEAISFDYRRLVGFTGTIRLKTVFSLRLSAFSMNRLFFPIAFGPGRVIVETSGAADIFESAENVKSFSPSRLVCWSVDSVFGLDVQKGKLDHYFSPAYLKPISTRGVVVDADERDSRAGGFLSRILRMVYLPF